MSADNGSSVRCFLCDSVVSGVIIQVYTDHLKTEHKVLINFKWIIDKSLGENSCAADTIDVIDVDPKNSRSNGGARHETSNPQSFITVPDRRTRRKPSAATPVYSSEHYGSV